MKLATALSERAELQRRISEIGTRLNQNAKVQEGEEPSEAPEMLLEELDRSVKRLEELIAGINRTNSATVHPGRPEASDSDHEGFPEPRQRQGASHDPYGD